MTGGKVTSQDLMRRQNARAILKAIHREAGIYRKKLAERTNLAAQTVTNIVTVLTQRNIVLEQPLSLGGKGRNPYALRLNYEGFYIISVRITHACIDVYLSSLDGGIVYALNETIHMQTDQPLQVLIRLLETVYEAYEKTHTISAIVISIVGIVNEKQGIVVEAYDLRWHNLNIREALGRFDTMVCVLNDVNIIAHYENATRADAANFLIVKVEDGVGSALVLGNRVLYSTNRVSGEFGHVTAFCPEETVECFCGRTNCLTQFISRGSLRRRLQKTYTEIKADVEGGVPETTKKIEEIGTLIAPKLLDLIVLLDLDGVILTGRVIEDFQDIIYPKVKDIIDQNLSFWVPFHRLEVKKYDAFTRICGQFLVEHYFSGENDQAFLWDCYL